MEPEQAVEFVTGDPNAEMAEREFSINFTKADELAWVHSTIASQVRRLLTHSDVETVELCVYNENNNKYSTETLNEFDGGDKIIWGISARLPIESLKIQGSPRKQRSYAQIISPQQEVNFE